MKYELVYTKDGETTEQIIGAQINKKFIPKQDGETEHEFLDRIKIIEPEHDDTGSSTSAS